MSATLKTGAVLDPPSEIEFRPPSSSSDNDSAAGKFWITRAVVVAVTAAMTWYTWGHWGDFQIDSGRELYVPAEILKGKLLFRDLWYMYGPLAPYVKAFLFHIFGVHLEVLFGFGVAMTFAFALLTIEVARRFGLGPVGSAVPAFFFLSDSFHPNIRNFIYPYAYASSVAALLGLIFLYFMLCHATHKRIRDLAVAALLGSLLILTKQEFGISCLVLLAFEVAADYWIRRSKPELLRNLGVCAAGLLPAAAVYGWFIWKVGAYVLFYVNWISTPGTYFMRTFGKITIPAQGLRFVPAELWLAAELLLLSLAEWALLASLAASSAKKLELNSRWLISGLTIAILAPVWVGAVGYRVWYPWTFVASWGWEHLLLPMSESVVPHGMYFVLAYFIPRALWKLVKAPRDEMALQEALLGLYAGLVGGRMIMMLRSSMWESTVFFNVPTFLVFVIVVYKIMCWACHSLDARRSSLVMSNMFIVESFCAMILFFPRPGLLPTKLTTPNGSFYTRTDAAAIFPQIISFMRSHTKNGHDILFLPEPPSMYTFAGMEAPSRWYSLVPGYVAPQQEQQFIDDVVSSQVRYVLISNRDVSEYKVRGFALGGYNPRISQWIMEHYQKAGQFGPLPGAPYPPYTVWIYERNDLVGRD